MKKLEQAPLDIPTTQFTKVFKSRENWEKYVDGVVKFAKDNAATVTCHNIVLDFPDERFETGSFDLEGTLVEYRAFTVQLPDPTLRGRLSGMSNNAQMVEEFVNNYLPENLRFQNVQVSRDEHERGIWFNNKDAAGEPCAWGFFHRVRVFFYPRAPYPSYVSFFLHPKSK